MDKITRMDGFGKLTREQQLELLNYKDNFVGLSWSANASKGAKSYADWSIYKKDGIPIVKEFRKEMIAKEVQLEKNIQKKIDDMLERK